jgi:uronate dehydrogenase
MIQPALARQYRLRLTDLRPADDGQAVSVGDLADPGFAAGLVDGVDAIVHLAANPEANAGWADLRHPNVDLVANLFEVAQAAGVSRVVLASSIHAMGGYNLRSLWPINPQWAPRPCCLYGTTKVFAEAMARRYSDAFGMSVICLRFGAVQRVPTHDLALSAWLSAGDAGRLVLAALAADVRFGAYFGVSANPKLAWDISTAVTELGYAPEDTAEDYAQTLVELPATPGCVIWPTAD